MRILLSGAAGGLGAPLANSLKNQGHELLLVDDLSNGYIENLARFDLDRELTVQDISNVGEMSKIFNSFAPQAVLNLAAVSSLADCQENPTIAYKSNVLGTLNLLELSRQFGVARFIQTSTSAVYENANSFEAHGFEDPHLIYPMSKLETERIVKSYNKVYGMPAMIFRIYNVLAPYQDVKRTSPPLLNYLIKMYMRGERPVLHSDGKQSRDYIVLADFLSAFTHALGCNAKLFDNALSLDICSGNRLSVSEIDKIVRDELRTELTPIYRSGELFWDKYKNINSGRYPIMKEIVLSEVLKSSLGNNELARDLLGWGPLDTHAELRKLIKESVTNFTD
jgi:UDP-glucose 4-epimerase